MSNEESAVSSIDLTREEYDGDSFRARFMRVEESLNALKSAQRAQRNQILNAKCAVDKLDLSWMKNKQCSTVAVQTAGDVYKCPPNFNPGNPMPSSGHLIPPAYHNFESVRYAQPMHTPYAVDVNGHMKQRIAPSNVLSRFPISQPPPKPSMTAMQVSNLVAQRTSPLIPQARAFVSNSGIVLEWTAKRAENLSVAKQYEIFTCHADSRGITPPTSWKKLGCVDAVPLPMACNLSSIEKNRVYFFIVRSIDHFERFGDWSDVASVFT